MWNVLTLLQTELDVERVEADRSATMLTFGLCSNAVQIQMTGLNCGVF